MQINKITATQLYSFKSGNDNIPRLDKGMLRVLMKSRDPELILKLSGQYPDFEASIIKQSQYERERAIKKVEKESKIIEHDLFSTETRAMTIIRFIKQGFNKWHHKKALDAMINSGKNNCNIEGVFYALKEDEQNYYVTRLYDGAVVGFDKSGKITQVKQNDYLMRTERYYFDEGREKPFLVCDGYQEKDDEITSQRTYYVGNNKRCFIDFKIKNGKKYYKEYFDFIKDNKKSILNKYKSAVRTISLIEPPNKYRYCDLSSGDNLDININN